MRERAALWVVIVFVLFVVVIVGGGGWWLANEMGIVDLRGGPDMEVTMSVSPGTVAAGESVTYTVNYANVGESPAGGVTVTVTLPQGVSAGEVSIPAACDTSESTVMCRLGSQNAGKRSSLTVTGAVASTATAGTVLQAQAVIATSKTRDIERVDSVTSNNTASATVTVK